MKPDKLCHYIAVFISLDHGAFSETATTQWLDTLLDSKDVFLFHGVFKETVLPCFTRSFVIISCYIYSKLCNVIDYKLALNQSYISKSYYSYTTLICYITLNNEGLIYHITFDILSQTFRILLCLVLSLQNMCCADRNMTL